MKTLKKTITLLLIALSVISCSSDDSAPYEVKANRITKEITENTTKTFSYNSNNQLTKITDLGDLGFGTTQSVENYTYSGSLVSEITTDYSGSSNYGFKYTYIYDGDKVVAINIKRYLGAGTYDNFSQLFFDYSMPNKIERAEYRADGTTTRTVYDIANGNPTSYSVYTGVTANTPNGQLNYTNVYSNYDDSKTPYAGLPLIFREPNLFTNNPRMTQSSGSTVNYSYEYNQDGYPTKKTTTFNSTTTTTTYVYERI